MSIRGIQEAINRLLDEVGIVGKSIHNLRHESALTLARADLPIYTIASHLCHQQITSSQPYIRTLEHEDFGKKIRKAFSEEKQVV